jgi:ABC-type transport system involved in multi-copper enzyme maturation permease subunit
MVGPILHHEMLLGSRRSPQYYYRWIYAGRLVQDVLWLGLFFMMTHVMPTSQAQEYALPVVSRWFVEKYLIWHLLLILVLVTPVLTAGAITDEKTRGTLQYLLTTDLLSWHIVLGKMLGRLAQLTILALTGLPLLCFFGAFAGLQPLALVSVVAVAGLPMLAVGSASILASVWCRTTRDAVLGVYAIGLVVFLLLWFFGGPVADYFNPLYVLQPGWGQNVNLPLLAERLGWSAVGWGSITVVCLSLAVLRLRPAYIRQMEGEGRKKKVTWWRVNRTAVTENPIPWKERHVEGLAPHVVLRRIPTWIAVLAVFLGTTGFSLFILALFLPTNLSLEQLLQHLVHLEFSQALAMLKPPPTVPSPAQGFFWMSVVAMLVASLVVGIRCSGAVSGERERQTWEALLLTPLTSRQLIRGKLWGIIGSSYVYLLAYAVPALSFAAIAGPTAFFWTALWLAVTWLAMYFVGAAGIWCSVRSRGSWRSLLVTLAIGYVGGGFIYAITTPVIAILAVFIVLGLMVVDYYLGTGFGSTAARGFDDFFYPAFKIASCLALAGIFWGLAWFFITDAQKWVADRERTRHWKDEPLRLRPRKKVPAQPKFYR